MTLPGFPEAAPLAGLAGGILIGLAAALMLLGLGRIAGVSGLAAKAVGLGGSGIARSGAWMFMIGLPLGALIVMLASGGIEANFGHRDDPGRISVPKIGCGVIKRGQDRAGIAIG